MAIKINITLIFIILATLLLGQNQNILDSTIWKTHFEESLQDSKNSNKPLVIVFSGSDWCKPCIKLKEYIFKTEEFNNWAKSNGSFYYADFPRLKKNQLQQNIVEQNEKLAEKYNPNGVFPLIVVLNNDEKILGQMGYFDISVNDYIKKFEEIINTNKK